MRPSSNICRHFPFNATDSTGNAVDILIAKRFSYSPLTLKQREEIKGRPLGNRYPKKYLQKLAKTGNQKMP
jgi:hypothetical protein